MEDINKIQSISEYNTLRGIKTLHPLASVYDSSTAKLLSAGNYSFSFYCIFLKDLKCGELKYGRNYYDYQEGTLVFISPSQVIGVPETPEGTTVKGWVLLFHPDLLKGTALGKNLDNYRFFSYSVNEALHISEKEREIVIDQMKKIQMEMEHSVDRHSKMIITASIELLLSYFSRFYDRQFLTRENEVKGTVERFMMILNAYFSSNRAKEEGLPTVSFIASELNLSPNYFGDLIKKETGISPLEHIQSKVINLAKERIFAKNKSLAEVSYELGFKYPQHFTRLFKKRVGISPNEYRGIK
jgi:AraC family transcriptional activator of pobA